MAQKSQPKAFMVRSSRWFLPGILLLSLFLNAYHADFPLGYHGDEPKKVRFVLTGDQDFHHPILLLQLTRLVNWVFGFTDEQQVAILGRIVSAVAGTMIVWFAFCLARRLTSAPFALLAALGVAVSPIMVVHAHYMKEDVLFTACALASLTCFLRLIEEPTLRNSVLLGLATGLAFSSHYKSALLIVLYPVFPIVAAIRNKRATYKWLCLSFAVAGYVFMNVNYPALCDPDVFLAGLKHELEHVTTGHSLRIYPIPHFFCFHLVHSVIPGMTLVLTILALCWIAVALFRWTRIRIPERLLLFYVLLYYIVPELSPSKPAPDFARYIIQIIPVMICFAYSFASVILNRLRSGLPKRLAQALLAVTVVLPLADSFLLDYHMADDTRADAAAWIEATGEKAVFEHYASSDWDVISIADSDVDRWRRQGVSFLVASSFRYERYFRGVQLEGQDDYVRQRYQKYVELFSHPYVEFRPKYRSYGFTNPVIRIIDIRRDKNDEADLRK